MLSRSIRPTASIASKTANLLTTTSSLISAQRNLFVFTPQSAVLQNNAKHLKYNSPVWVEEDDEWWWKKVTQLKSEKERPTEIVIPRLLEYYNIECLADPSKLEGYEEAMADFRRQQLEQEKNEEFNANNNNKKNNNNFQNNHRSWRTKLPFRFSINDELEQAARQHNYTQSKFWITANEVRKQKLALQRSARVTGILIETSCRLFNADQFQDPDKITKFPVSGYKRRQYGGSFFDYLSTDVKNNNYSTGLYFTLNQLELFGLASKLKADAIPAEVPLTDLRGSQKLFNLDDVENRDKVMKDLNRAEMPAIVNEKTGETQHFYLISGRPVNHSDTAAAMRELLGKNKSTLKSAFWVSEQDLLSRGFKLKEKAEGVDFQWANNKNNKYPGSSAPKVVLLYNADQLLDRTEGLKIAGTKNIL